MDMKGVAMSKRESLKAKDFFVILDQLNNYDDRSLVIVGGAFVEASLTNLIEKNLKESNGTTKILSSTFSNKIELANSIGIISEREYNDLNCLRNLRNKFAHLMILKSIDDEEVKPMIRNLTFNQLGYYKEDSRKLLKIFIGALGIGLTLRGEKLPNNKIERDVYDDFELFAKRIGNAIFKLIEWKNK